jgi:hypothetical protein
MLTTFKENLAELINEHTGGNANKFSQLIGINPITFHNYKTGNLPRPDLLIQISEKLNISINWFLLGVGPKYVRDIPKPTAEEKEKAEILRRAEV